LIQLTDEPTGNLDSKNVVAVMDLLRSPAPERRDDPHDHA
jgi:ABC-type lipoprotein export system ATPase subunit